MKKSIQTMAIVLVIVVVLSAVATVLLLGTRAGHTHYVCLEVNPRVEFLTDSKHRVKSFKPLNSEAKELLIGEDIIGQKIEDICVKFLTLCAKSGYIDPEGENNAIKISVLSNLNQGLEVKLHQKANEFFVKNNILGVVVETQDDLSQWKDAKTYGVSTEKYDLMLAVQESDHSTTLNDLKKLSIKKLINKIEDLHKEYKFEYTDNELERKNNLLSTNNPKYEKHLSLVNSQTTRDFKETLKEYKKQAIKKYKLNFDREYENYIVG